MISIHALRVEGDPRAAAHLCRQVISIHALRVEGDPWPAGGRPARPGNFYPRPPCGGRPRYMLLSARPVNFYPRPPCGGRRRVSRVLGPRDIHFYPRPPCGGRRHVTTAGRLMDDFYPRPPCGGRRITMQKFYIRDTISIHALRVEGDDGPTISPDTCQRFLSTPSVWRATPPILALPLDTLNFYPRPPCGGRRWCIKQANLGKEFLSTPSVWRATTNAAGTAVAAADFYPRPPCGGRPMRKREIMAELLFLSTPSVWRATGTGEQP